MPSLDATLTAQASVLIHASAPRIWATLTRPDLIRAWLFGTHAVTDWKVGSPIAFSGVYGPESTPYHDKGVVVQAEEPTLLAYRYWSSFSGLEDLPEYYSLVTYRLDPAPEGIAFTWQQTGFTDASRRDHTQQLLPALLAQIKALSESTA